MEANVVQLFSPETDEPDDPNEGLIFGLEILERYFDALIWEEKVKKWNARHPGGAGGIA